MQIYSRLSPFPREAWTGLWVMFYAWMYGKGKFLRHLSLLDIPMGALAIATKSPKVDQHWKAVQTWPGLVSGNWVRSQLTESRDLWIWGLHPSRSINSQAGASFDSLLPSSMVLVPSLSLSYLPSFLTFSLNPEALLPRQWCLIPSFTQEFMVQQLSSKRKKIRGLHRQPCFCHRNVRKKKLHSCS